MDFQLLTFNNPNPSEFAELSKRPANNLEELFPLVKEVFEKVSKDGEKAVSHYTLKFDNVEISDFLVSEEEISLAEETLDKSLKKSIRKAANNIEKFHRAYTPKNKVEKIETTKGVFCWAKYNAIEKVGVYIPGGTAPLFSSVLMLGIPAKIAECKKVVLCSPPNKEGNIHPAILFAAKLCGITQIYKVGGIQAIAAMAIGTQSIPKVYKIFGPGNSYVNAAKIYSQISGTAIDLPAGPSEVAVYAGDGASPVYAASDLIAQAEHGHDSQVILIAKNKDFVKSVELEIQKQLAENPRKDLAIQSLKNSKAIVFEDLEKAMDFINFYAPEHLILLDDNALKLSKKVINSGSVFVGHLSSESAGDYASGTNHTLPTSGAALAYSGVSVDSFRKRITFQSLSKTGLKNLGTDIINMAEAEELYGHANSIKLRQNQYQILKIKTY
jgi:histidinol dehydrogenase